MRAGEFPDGAHVLRARSTCVPNMNLRDPLLYRIRHAHHHRTGDAWCIYPMYDYAHGQSDAIEGITHSHLHAGVRESPPAVRLVHLSSGRRRHHPAAADRVRAAEPLEYTVLSKRKLLSSSRAATSRLGRPAHAHPRGPPPPGRTRPRRCGRFCDRIGVARRDGVIDLSLLDHTVREDLNARSPA
jgi:glutaminyl-tRNA synthetase